MQDWHRVFVQAVMSRGFMTGKEVFSLVKDIANEFNGKPGFPTIRMDEQQKDINENIAVLIEDLHKTANHHLDKVKFQIKKGMEELKMEDHFVQYYAFVPLEENEQIAKLQKNYTEPELEFLRLICQHLVDERVDGMDTENNLINLSLRGGLNSTKKKLTNVEATKTLRFFISQGYLIRRNTRGQKGGRIALGARLLMELECWLEKYTDIKKCASCSKPVVINVQCPNKNCESTFHKFCVESKSRCTECRQTIKLEGVAAKR